MRTRLRAQARAEDNAARAQLQAFRAQQREQLNAARALDRRLVTALRRRHREELRLFRRQQRDQLREQRIAARQQERAARELFGDQLDALREQLDADLLSQDEFTRRRIEFAESRDAVERQAQAALAAFEAELEVAQAALEMANTLELDALRQRLEGEHAARQRQSASSIGALQAQLEAAKVARETQNAEEIAALEEQLALAREQRELESEERIAQRRLELQLQYEQTVEAAALKALDRSVMLIQSLVERGIISPIQGAIRELQTLRNFESASPAIGQQRQNFQGQVGQQGEQSAAEAQANLARANDIRDQIARIRDEIAERAHQLENPPFLEAIADAFGASNRQNRLRRQLRELRTELRDLEADLRRLVPLQSGGIVTRPTRALLGEAGPEAVIPLDRLGSGQVGGGGDTYNITINPRGHVLAADDLVEMVGRGLERRRRRGRQRAL